MRGVCSSRRRSWVEKMNVSPSTRFRSRIRSISCVALRVSRLAVGSSASTSAGGHNRTGHSNALALAAREQIGTMMRACCESHAFEGLRHAGATLTCAHALHEQRELDIFRRCENGDEIECLKDEADLFAAQRGRATRRKLRSIHAADEDTA